MFPPRPQDKEKTALSSDLTRPYWYALSTRSRHEHTVERTLQRLGVETYLPLKRTWSARRDRRLQIMVPALPGYLFLHCILTPDLRASIKKAPGVVALLTVNDMPCRIPESQIDSLRILLASQLEVETLTTLQPGQPVRIRSGPLKGVHGLLSRVDARHHRLIVQIEHVGLALSVELHEADVEALI